ncbi:DNA translocase FtsK 4TM domain-containing protein, partial [Pantoea sp.]
MSQEYTEDKDVSLQPLSSGRRLLEALLILVALFAIYLMVSLVSFNPSDPSWSQTAWHEPIHNIGGSVGAWLADTLLFIFGIMAYAIPPVILGLCWITFRQRDRQDYIDYFAVGLRLIGVLALVVTTCGLAALNADDIWYFASGGVIGSLVSNAMAPWFSPAGGTLTLLCVWAAGITLYTGWSWLTIAEKIGGAVMGVLTLASNRSRHDEPWEEEDDEEDIVESRSSGKAAIDNDIEDDVLLAAPRKHELLEAEVAERQNPLLTTAAPASAQSAMPDDAQSATTPAAAPVSTYASTAAVAQPAPTPAAASAPPATPPATTPAAAPQNPNISPAPEPTAAPTSAFTAQREAPPLYRFDIPDEQPAGIAGYSQPEEDEGPQMGDWREATTHAPEIPVGATAVTVAAVSAAQTTHSAPFIPAFSAAPEGEYNPQVKQGIGPELPRPNPVKIPTRRELASFGIKLPSQRLAEEKAKETEQKEPVAPIHDSGSVEDDAALQEAQLREAFNSQQQQRYGESWQQNDDEDDEETRHQASLARQFAEQQQHRYTQPEIPQDDGPTFSLDPAAAFDFSPMKDLVDEGPVEPL